MEHNVITPPNDSEESVLLRSLKESLANITATKNSTSVKNSNTKSTTVTSVDVSSPGTSGVKKMELQPHMEVGLDALISVLKSYSSDVIRPIKPLPPHIVRTALFFINETIKSRYEIEQMCGQALGYPRYADDPQNFPNIDPHDPSVCVGDHTAESIVAELASKYKKLGGF